MPTPDRTYLLRMMTRDLLLAGRQWRKIARHSAADHGVSEAATAPLVWIDYLGENCRQNALAEAVGIEGASLVRLLDGLEASGLVIRETDPSDRRAKVISLTQKGRAIVSDIQERLAVLRAEVFADIADSELAAATAIFAAIAQRAGAPGTDTKDEENHA